MPALDCLVAEAVMYARIIERATHDPGPWTARLGDCVVPADRGLEDSSIVFQAQFPPLPVTSGVIELCCRGEVVTCRSAQIPHGRGFQMEWLMVLESVAA